MATENKPSQELLSEINKIDPGKMKHVEPVVENSLPSAEAIAQEKTEAELRERISSFDSTKLKHIEPQEKTVLPNQDEIAQEKTEVELRERIGSFSMDSLKHAETVEKLVLPNKEGSGIFDFACCSFPLPPTVYIANFQMFVLQCQHLHYATSSVISKVYSRVGKIL